MATSRDRVYDEMREMFGQVPHWAEHLPEAAAGAFWGLMRDFYFAQTKIPNKYKELIGLGIAGATRCEYCAKFHTEAARLYGATEDEIAEACMMGAFTMVASTFVHAQLEDFDTFVEQTDQMLSYVREHAQGRQGGEEGSWPEQPGPASV